MQNMVLMAIKVIKTCTDNGANIVKAFKEYGSDLPGISSTGSTEQSKVLIQFKHLYVHTHGQKKVMIMTLKAKI